MIKLNPSRRLPVHYAKLLFSLILVIPLIAFAAQKQVVEIDISGMACQFCVYGLKKNLNKLPDVEQVDISLKNSKGRIAIAPGKTADIKKIKQAIIDAGFTPGKATTTTQDE